MFLAPLNYDRFFKRIFSDLTIAKVFLEDFLDVTIEEINKLETENRITDDASSVEFDFRCKIKGTYVIIDMQQWYKRDIGKRFYLYHAVNTSLQLEKLPKEKKPISTLTRRKITDYSALEPVITLVWMSTDNFGFEENYIAYAMTPETVGQFVRNERLWLNPDILEIMKERTQVLKVIDNNKKDLDFLPQNRLIFMFQRNIVKNKTHARYERWFTFAEKSRNEENNEADFEEYKSDLIFKEIIQRLEKRKLKKNDIEYIEQEKKYWFDVVQFDRSSYENGRTDGKKEGRKEGIEEGRKEGIEEGRKEGIEQGISEEKRNIARNLKSQQFSNDFIATVTGLSQQEIEQL